MRRDLRRGGLTTTGSARIWRELRKAGVMINEKRVRRLMRLHGLAGRCIRRRVRNTFPGPDGYMIPDLVGRNFAPGDPDRAWCQDITYLDIRIIHAATGELIRHPHPRHHPHLPTNRSQTGGGPSRPYGPHGGKQRKPEP